MYSVQVARSFDSDRLHVDEYLTEEPLTSEQKAKLIGKDSMLRDTHEVPIVFFPKPNPPWRATSMLDNTRPVLSSREQELMEMAAGTNRKYDKVFNP